MHYGVGVVPARLYKPRDKAKVESGVQLVERHQNTQFPGDLCHFPIAELKPQIPSHAPNDDVISEATAVEEGIAAILSAHPLILLHILQSTLNATEPNHSFKSRSTHRLSEG